jgi:hypothetical protein
MTYVFDRSEELTEYWGCSVSTDGLCILSVARDLTGQPLKGIKTKSQILWLAPTQPAIRAAALGRRRLPEKSKVGLLTHRTYVRRDLTILSSN